MKKFISFILAAAVMMSGCSRSGSITTFTLAVENIPANFDPQIADSKEDLLVIENIYDGLFEKLDGKVVNNLAESCDISADGRTYTITIKSDAIYTYKAGDDRKDEFDGKHVTADDFVFALQRVADPQTHSPYIDDFSNIKNASAVKNGAPASSLGVRASGDDTLIIQLENPDYNFAEKLCSPAAYPCNRSFFSGCGGAYGLSIENMLTNGPFRLTYLDDENGNATIVRNDDSSGAVARIRLVQASAREWSELYSSESISGYFSFDGSSAPSGSQSVSYDSSVLSLVFNRSKGSLANENVRKSLAWYAFAFTNSGANMQAVKSCSSLFPSSLSLGGQPIADAVGGYTPSYMSQQPSRLLQQGMSELGSARIETMTILMPSDSVYSLIYENINQLWQRDLGLYFTIEYLPSAEISRRVKDGDYDLAFMSLTPDSDTPYGILDFFSRYNGQVSSLCSEARAMSDQGQAASLVARAQRTVLEGALAAPMGSESTVFIYRNYFTGLYANPFTQAVNLKHAFAS